MNTLAKVKEIDERLDAVMAGLEKLQEDLAYQTVRVDEIDRVLDFYRPDSQMLHADIQIRAPELSAGGLGGAYDMSAEEE